MSLPPSTVSRLFANFILVDPKPPTPTPLSFRRHILHKEKSNQLSKVQGKHSPFQSSFLKRTNVSPLHSLLQLRYPVWPGTQKYRNLRTTVTKLLPSAYLGVCIKLFAIPGCSTENHIHFSTVQYNMIRSHHKMQGQELSSHWTSGRGLPSTQIQTEFFSSFLIMT